MNEIVIRLPKRVRGVANVPDDVPWPPVSPPRANLPQPPQVAPLQPESFMVEPVRAERQSLEVAIVGLRDAINAVEQQRQQQIADLQTFAIELALTIATRIFHQEISAGRFPLEALVHDMIAPFAGSPSLHVYLNPVDLRDLRERLDGKPLPAVNGDVLRMAADPALVRGDCRVEDGDRVLVSQVAEQMRSLREEMLASVGHEAA